MGFFDRVRKDEGNKLPYSRIDLENDLSLAAELVAMLQASSGRNNA